MSEKNSLHLMTIGEIARRSGVSVSAIRFYEEKGLIFSLRTNGQQRRYARHMLRRLAVIKAAQKVGLSLQQIHLAFAQLPSQKPPTKQEWQNMSQQWQQQLAERIQLLQHMQHQLDWCIGCGCLSLDHCPLRNPDDAFAANPSAHPYWEERTD